jgi:hypothetical protein
LEPAIDATPDTDLQIMREVEEGLAAYYAQACNFIYTIPQELFGQLRGAVGVRHREAIKSTPAGVFRGP